jgi:carbamoyl-phosphate synthase large subunit
MRVLISSPRGKERLVKAFEQAGAEVVRTLLEVPQLIVPTVDEELPFFAINREWFQSQGVEVMVSSDYTISICRDKAEFYRFCVRHGFKTPTTMQETLIAKPRFGKGSKGLIKLDRSYIVQPLIDLPEVSIDYFADLDGTFVSAVPRFRLNVVNGESQEMASVPDFDFETVKRLGTELHLVGHNVIQGFWDGKETTFIEVNPRFGGGSWMTFDIFNSPKVLMESIQCMLTRKSYITQQPS